MVTVAVTFGEGIRVAWNKLDPWSDRAILDKHLV
jgi:hypothetical protein